MGGAPVLKIDHSDVSGSFSSWAGHACHSLSKEALRARCRGYQKSDDKTG